MEKNKMSAKQFTEAIRSQMPVEEVMIDEVVFSNETFLEEIHVANSTFGKITFHNCIFEKAVRFCNVVFQQEVVFNFDEEEHKDAGRTIYKDNVTFEQCTFEGNVRSKSAIFEANVNFSESIFQKRVSFANVTFSKEVAFPKAQFLSSTRFEAANFHGTTTFEQAVFVEKANFKKSYFHSTFLFRKTLFKSNTTFENANFIGFSRFEDMECIGKFSLKKVTMGKKGYFHRMKLHDEGIFRSIEAKEALYFSWMNCASSLDFSGIESFGPFYFQENTCNGTVLFSQSVFHHDMHLLGSQFFDRLNLRQTVFHMRLNCTDAIFHKDVVLYACSPSILILKKQQIQNKIASHREKQYAQAKEVYVMLRRSFDHWGEHENSEWAYYNFRKAEFQSQKSKNPLKKIKRFFYWFLFDVGCGYGTKPINVTILAAFVVFVFSVIYWTQGQHFIVSSGLRSTSTPISFFQALYISSMNFVTMGTEGIAPSLDHWVKYFIAIEGFIGLFLMTVFVGTYTRKMAK